MKLKFKLKYNNRLCWDILEKKRQRKIFCCPWAKATACAGHASSSHVSAAYKSWDLVLQQAVSQKGQREGEKSHISGSHLAKWQLSQFNLALSFFFFLCVLYGSCYTLGRDGKGSCDNRAAATLCICSVLLKGEKDIFCCWIRLLSKLFQFLIPDY